MPALSESYKYRQQTYDLSLGLSFAVQISFQEAFLDSNPFTSLPPMNFEINHEHGMVTVAFPLQQSSTS